MMNSKLLYFFSLFFIHFCCVYSLNSTHKCSDEQRDALLLFKQNLDSINESGYRMNYDVYNFCSDQLGFFDYKPIMMNWNTSVDCCHWGGVTCSNLTGDVESLDLRCGMLQGVVELDTLLSRLPKLEALGLSYNVIRVMTNNVTDYVKPDLLALDLAYCNLTVFPEFLRAMRNLEYLDMSNNFILGPVPSWIPEIGNELVFLDLHSNMIHGNFPLPFCNTTHLNYLDISDNSIDDMGLQGLEYIVPPLVSLNMKSNMFKGLFPTAICNMSILTYLDMSHNSFHGVIPQCFGNITSSLSMMNLGYNNFHGTIPNVYETCTLSVGLILSANQLEGEVPRSLLKCQYLKVLDLENNHLEGNFPRWLEDLTRLEVLILRSNKLDGVIDTPSTMGFPFPRVQIFDISNNGFVGRLPTKYFENFNAIKDLEKDPTHGYTSDVHYYIPGPLKEPQVLYPQEDSQLLLHDVLVKYTIIDLSNNEFEGEIPCVLGALNSLIALNLSHNNLTGEIPHDLTHLSSIEALDLSCNQLTGEIPRGLLDLMYLDTLNLSQNNLVGRIPDYTHSKSFNGLSFQGNSGLCGFPLTDICEDVSSPHVEDDGDTDEIGLPWEVVMLGFGCGTLLGLLMGYHMFSIGKPKWFNAIPDAIEPMIPTRKKKRKHGHIRKQRN